MSDDDNKSKVRNTSRILLISYTAVSFSETKLSSSTLLGPRKHHKESDDSKTLNSETNVRFLASRNYFGIGGGIPIACGDGTDTDTAQSWRTAADAENPFPPSVSWRPNF